jgi:hypothetical protein
MCRRGWSLLTSRDVGVRRAAAGCPRRLRCLFLSLSPPLSHTHSLPLTLTRRAGASSGCWLPPAPPVSASASVSSTAISCTEPAAPSVPRRVLPASSSHTSSASACVKRVEAGGGVGSAVSSYPPVPPKPPKPPAADHPLGFRAQHTRPRRIGTRTQPHTPPKHPSKLRSPLACVIP